MKSLILSLLLITGCAVKVKPEKVQSDPIVIQGIPDEIKLSVTFDFDADLNAILSYCDDRYPTDSVAANECADRATNLLRDVYSGLIQEEYIVMEDK